MIGKMTEPTPPFAKDAVPMIVTVQPIYQRV